MARRKFLVLSSLAIIACSTLDDRSVDVGSAANEPGTAGATAPAGPATRGSGSTPDGSSSDDSAGTNQPASGGRAVSVDTSCPDEVRAAVPSPLDLLIQLDASGSMLEPLPADVTAITKWDAVRQGLEQFVQAPENAPLGVGLSYFPELLAGVPFACATNADCGAGGPCTSSVCVQPYALDPGAGRPLVSFLGTSSSTAGCSSDLECGTGQSCRAMRGVCVLDAALLPPGVDASGAPLTPVCDAPADCAGQPGAVCDQIGLCDATPGTLCTPSIACPAGAGNCLPFTYTCLKQTRCEAAAYATPAVPIGAASTGARALVASLAARVPAGLTPTGPALEGALAYATSWAQQHPERQVATVFATDGFPTECEPFEIPAIAALVSAAAGNARPVKTFVIGVFGSTDLGAEGQQRLDALATAGATGQAFMAGVSGAFSRALQDIRASAESCGFALDPAAQREPDGVNLELVDQQFGVRSLRRVAGAASCASDAWYYVLDAVGSAARFELCPDACPAASGSTHVQLRRACAASGD